MTAVASIAPSSSDLVAIKGRQQATWAAGDYAVIGTTLQIVGEHVCEAIDLRAGERVLDVAAGNGNASLAAARRWAKVVATDYVGALLDRAKERASPSSYTSSPRRPRACGPDRPPSRPPRAHAEPR